MKMFTTLLLLATVMSVSAQHIKDPLHHALKDRPDGDIIRSIMSRQTEKARYAFKVTALKHRLLAYSYYNSGGMQDSTAYTYSGGRGAEVTDYASYSDNYLPTYYQFRQPNIMYDTKTSWHKDFNRLSLTWENTMEYDPSGKLTEYASRYDPYFDDYYAIQYNASGLPTLVSVAEGSTNNTKWEMYIMYDGQNRRIMDSTHNVKNNKPDGKRVYEYDAAGNMAGFSSYYYSSATASMRLSFKSAYVYDNNNRMIYSLGQVDKGGSMGNSSTDTFSYTGTAKQCTEHKFYAWDDAAGAWIPNQLFKYHLNAQNNIDTYYIHEWNATTTQMDTIERDVLYYNSNNLISYTHGYKYTGNGTYSSTPYDKQNYYWQDYDPTAITNAELPQQSLRLHPNPATDRITISGIQNGSYTIASIYGGRVMGGNIAGSTVVSIEHLPQGNYILYTKDNTGKGQVERFIKQ